MQQALMSFNENAYKQYCKAYKEYWEWVEERNEERYQNTLEHGKNYDAKNMMHTFRLLDMAEEIASEKSILVKKLEDRAYFSVTASIQLLLIHYCHSLSLPAENQQEWLRGRSIDDQDSYPFC